jgi:lipopolysaccharide biosynthesis protein
MTACTASFPLDGIFDSTTVRDCDFWGITESTKIAPHLQSYFLVFSLL